MSSAVYASPLAKRLILACACWERFYVQTPADMHRASLPSAVPPQACLPLRRQQRARYPSTRRNSPVWHRYVRCNREGLRQAELVDADIPLASHHRRARLHRESGLRGKQYHNHALQVCAARLVQSEPTSGKLLLGEVNLYADGPASGNYTDNIGAHPSGIGTPALIIPSFFWGIEGVSRGASPGSTATHPPPGQGTFLSVCSGTGKPINNTNEGPGSGPCTTAFPKRSFSISSNTVSGNAMTIVLTTTPGSGSLYPAELVMVKGSTPFSENGTYKLQSFSGATLTVTVPTGTGNCTGGCGTLL